MNLNKNALLNDLQTLNTLKLLKQMYQDPLNLSAQPINNYHPTGQESSYITVSEQRQLKDLNELVQGFNLNQINARPMPNINSNPNDSLLDRLAKFHRSSAAMVDTTCTWSGVLQPRAHKVVNYSPKVFLGGIPWDINEPTLIQIFRQFGPVRYSKHLKPFLFSYYVCLVTCFPMPNGRIPIFIEL